MGIKVKVVIPFTDKETKKKYNKGDIITLTARRYSEILKRGNLVELVEEKEAEKSK
jgi:hypothetical protein